MIKVLIPDFSGDEMQRFLQKYPDGVLISDCGCNRILYANPKCRVCLGADTDKLDEQFYYDVIGGNIYEG